MVYLNLLLIIYNILFVLYASMAYHMNERSYLITFLPVLYFFQTLYLTNFTLRYYSLARVMSIYFTNDVLMAMRKGSPGAIKTNKRVILGLEIAIYLVTAASSFCFIVGDKCISDRLGAGKVFIEGDMSVC